MIDKVRVIRYLRGTQKKNLGGATLIFDINYDTREIEVRLSICSDKDNFCKSLGKETAEYNGIIRKLHLDLFRKCADHRCGFTNAYIAMIETDSVKERQLHDLEKMLLRRVLNCVVE